MLGITMSWWAGVRSEAYFASLSAALLPHEMRSEATWWPWQCMMPASIGIVAAFRSWCISGALVMGDSFVERSPYSFQMAACEYMIWEVYLESVYLCAHLLAARRSALGTAISSACWEEVPAGRFNNLRVRNNCISSYSFSFWGCIGVTINSK